MVPEDKPGEAADDGMADWAEALLEQKSSEPGDGEPQSGGVLSGDAPRPFSSMPQGGGDAPVNDINMVLDKGLWWNWMLLRVNLWTCWSTVT
jgi:flagellar motor switch protein FliN/FliY